MKVEELLTTYWSQTTLILLGIGYIIKKILDGISNKREFNHKLFQQYRLKAISDFFSSYAKTEQMLKDISIDKVLEYKVETKEMDKIVFTPIDELRKNILELRIYFPNEEEHSIFNEILENALKINAKLSAIYFNYDKETSPIVKSNNFRSFRDEKIAENNRLIADLSIIIRRTFK